MVTVIESVGLCLSVLLLAPMVAVHSATPTVDGGVVVIFAALFLLHEVFFVVLLAGRGPGDLPAPFGVVVPAVGAFSAARSDGWRWTSGLIVGATWFMVFNRRWLGHDAVVSTLIIGMCSYILARHLLSRLKGRAREDNLPPNQR